LKWALIASVIVDKPKETLLFVWVRGGIRSLMACLRRMKTSLMFLFMSTAMLFLLLLLEAQSLVVRAIYLLAGRTLPGQRGMFMMWQNFSLRMLLLCKSWEIKAREIFLSPK
jgi:hypothetical protein